MSRRLSTPVLRTFLLFFWGAILLQAQSVTWTGLGHDDYNDTPENWLGNVLPKNNGTEEFIFGPAVRSHLLFRVDINARKVSIVGNSRPYQLDEDLGIMTIGADGLVYAPALPVLSRLGAYPTIVPVDQTWDIQSGELEVEYNLEGAGRINKTGAGTLVIGESQNHSWSGGLQLTQGTAVIRSDYYANLGSYYSPLGTGTLIFNGGTLATRPSRYNDDDSPVNLENAIVSNGLISTRNEVELRFAAIGEGGESITLNTNTTIQSQGEALHVLGGIAEAAAGKKLTINSDGAVILHGSSGWTGGTDVTKGVLIFAGEDNVTSTGTINVGSLGYVGISLDQNVGGFIGQIDTASTGAIGFDSDPTMGTDTFITPIDLSAFASGSPIRLGSATSAILDSAAVITPQGTSYRFGGGGGELEVQSALTNAAGPVTRNVVLDSPAELPLTVRFTNPGNTLTGGVSATHSAAIFGPGALPATGTLTLGTGGYIGVEDIAQGSGLTQNFINRFAPATDRGMIGFDAASEHVTISDDISLAGFTDAAPGIYLGTATRAVITGTITPQGGIYRFGAYKGGFLTVSSTLGGAGNSVHIGDPSSLGTMGDFQQEEYSTVRLAGNNTHGGTTTLFTGRLDLGHANALGIGALIVQPHSLSLPVGEEDVRPELTADSGLTIANAIDLNADLNIGGIESDLTLSGPITGGGELYLDSEYFGLTLSGNNSAFSGGIYIGGYNNALTLGSNNAAGTGPLGFGGGSSHDVYLTTTAPVIGGLMSREPYDYAEFYAQQTNTVLTINQSFDSQFDGYFRSNAVYPADNFRIVKNGGGTLRLNNGGMYFYHGTTEATLPGTPEVSLQVNQGRLVLNYNFSMGETSGTTVWVHGGTLQLDGGIQLGNPLVIDSGGRLEGYGGVSMATIGTGATLSPGSLNGGQIGFLNFSNHLTLAAGGTYEWNLANPGGFIFDYVHVSGVETLSITATSANKFTLKAITLGTDGNPGILAGAIGPNASYSWMLMSALSITPNGGTFDPNAFTLDVSQFRTDVGTGLALGTFSVSLANGDTQLMLNLTTFAGIPEPSTYALLALGLGFLGLTAWRKRRAS